MRERTPRRGALLLESVVALMVIVTITAVAARVTAAIDRGLRVDDQKRVAVQALSNSIERATALAWNEVSTDRVTALLNESTPSRLTAARWEACVEPFADATPTKSIRITLSWSPTPGAARLERSLTTFLYPATEEPR